MFSLNIYRRYMSRGRLFDVWFFLKCYMKIFSRYTVLEQLGTAGVQYIVSGSWKNKLFAIPWRESRKCTKIHNIPEWYCNNIAQDIYTRTVIPNRFCIIKASYVVHLRDVKNGTFSHYDMNENLVLITKTLFKNTFS